MTYQWIRENPCRWDDDKQRIVGGQPQGVFDLGTFQPGESVPGEWWRVEDDDRIVGYAWMDRTWDGAEILLAVDPRRQRTGAGSFMLEQLAREARTRGLSQLYNVVRPEHPERVSVTKWLIGQGFKATDDGELRRAVPRR